jgi:hypothetical protein
MTHPGRRFVPLEQSAFLTLEQATYLKGLLRVRGVWRHGPINVRALRDALIELAQKRVLAQANGYPFRLLPVQLAQQNTGAGTSFLRWRKPDRSAMGVTRCGRN